MIMIISEFSLDIALNKNEGLKIRGLSQYKNERTRQNVLLYLKSCKPEIIKKIKAGIEIDSGPQVHKMSVCIDSMPCQNIGVKSDDTGTFAVCLYNGGKIHEQGFICPLATERFKKRWGVQARPLKKYKPKKKNPSVSSGVQPVEPEPEPEEIKPCELPRWAM